jgi:hypothetical protein
MSYRYTASQIAIAAFPVTLATGLAVLLFSNGFLHRKTPPVAYALLIVACAMLWVLLGGLGIIPTPSSIPYADCKTRSPCVSETFEKLLSMGQQGLSRPTSTAFELLYFYATLFGPLLFLKAIIVGFFWGRSTASGFRWVNWFRQS